MISFDEAATALVQVARPLEADLLGIESAFGRTLAKDVTAAIDAPRQDVSAMDGYAVQDDALVALPARLRITSEVFAGAGTAPALGPGECARIFTGGAVPGGADRIVVQEAVRRDGEWAFFDEAPGPGRHIRRRGSDFVAGDTLAGAGQLLNARALVAIAGGDIAEVEVFRRPRFAVLSTGDELATPGHARDVADKIPESISVGLAALGSQWGAECIGRAMRADDLPSLASASRELLAKVDLLVVTGGASVGERDFAKSMFGPDGLEIIFSKVAIKPGKPVWLGKADGRLVLGLPGNPTSAMVTARLFLAPLIAGLSGRDPQSALHWQTATLQDALPPEGDRETFVRARWSGERVESLRNQDSAAQRELAAADLLIRRPRRASAASAGDAVSVLAF